MVEQELLIHICMMCINMYTYAHLNENGAHNIIVNNVTMTPTIFNSLVTNYNNYATQSWVPQHCLTIQNDKMSFMYNTGRGVVIGFDCAMYIIYRFS